MNVNANINHVENTVDNYVNVKIDLDLSGALTSPADNDAIDIDSIHGLTDSIVMPDVVSQATHNGNNFNIDQINNLTDNDTLHDPSVSYSAGGLDPSSCNPYYVAEAVGGFSMSASASGGTAETHVGAIQGGNDGFAGIGAASANVSLTQEAFTQHIAMGANIQFNSVDHLTVSGGDLGDL